ncbi:hypothetical protein F5Y16DRAFT_355201 [Xylariaceae sp. FL0255]|nr:hypothetical protein F5Y16DRAFT_355201 [Xylariaceae sp. FL0255]
MSASPGDSNVPLPRPSEIQGHPSDSRGTIHDDEGSSDGVSSPPPSTSPTDSPPHRPQLNEHDIEYHVQDSSDGLDQSINFVSSEIGSEGMISPSRSHPNLLAGSIDVNEAPNPATEPSVIASASHHPITEHAGELAALDEQLLNPLPSQRRTRTIPETLRNDVDSADYTEGLHHHHDVQDTRTALSAIQISQEDNGNVDGQIAQGNSSATVHPSPPAPRPTNVDRHITDDYISSSDSILNLNPLPPPTQEPTLRSPPLDTPLPFTLPEWQPDHESIHCPICGIPFGLFIRKHHCRKCGRVVCGSCSPHRITIPHSYIVRPPWDQRTFDTYILTGAVEGGERVRLCNPCVPDPNTAPPQAREPPLVADGRSGHSRSRSNFGANATPPAYSQSVAAGHPHRNRSVSMHAGWPEPPQLDPYGHSAFRNGQNSQGFRAGSAYYAPAPFLAPQVRPRPHWAQPAVPGPSPVPLNQSLNRPLPRSPPAIAEDDECPVCHQELPSRDQPDFETLRESHINNCIISHSSFGNRQHMNTDGAPLVRQTRLILYRATEKECVSNEECSICLEEFKDGDSMGRLECLCRFHRTCIESWFRAHPGRCPVHQHDSYGF